MMKIDVLSLFPNMFTALQESMIGKALENNIVDLQITDFRDYSHDKHHHVDDTPYGGGAGMLLEPQPIFRAMDHINEQDPNPKRVILLDPAGRTFDQQFASELAHEDHLVFICGHYEGYDERIRSLVTDEVSLGDYVITGGELGAMVMIDAIVRLLPGVLGNDTSAKTDSFADGLLEYPQYTRPAEYRGMRVPEVLMSGNHQLIAQWRMRESLRRTLQRRPDLLKKATLTTEQKHILAELVNDDYVK